MQCFQRSLSRQLKPGKKSRAIDEITQFGGIMPLTNNEGGARHSVRAV
jgi:hypothetical protein